MVTFPSALGKSLGKPQCKCCLSGRCGAGHKDDLLVRIRADLVADRLYPVQKQFLGFSYEPWKLRLSETLFELFNRYVESVSKLSHYIPPELPDLSSVRYKSLYDKYIHKPVPAKLDQAVSEVDESGYRYRDDYSETRYQHNMDAACKNSDYRRE